MFKATNYRPPFTVLSQRIYIALIHLISKAKLPNAINVTCSVLKAELDSPDLLTAIPVFYEKCKIPICGW